MDIEETVAFILDSQRRAEERAEKADRRMDRAEQRMDRAEQRMDRAEQRAEKTDRRIDAIAKLMQVGMKRLARIEEDQAELRQALKDLAAEGRETRKELRAFIAASRNGRNGNGASGRHAH